MFVVTSCAMAALATEDEIRSARWLAGQPGRRYGVCITKSNLVIKFAPAAKMSQEATAINFVSRQCPDIPAPEILGSWEATGADGEKRGYIAMSVLPGSMLRDVWSTMNNDDKTSILDNLAAILTQLRCIQIPTDAMIGQVFDGLGLAADVRGSGAEFGGPFLTESDLNEWLISLIHPESREIFGSFYVETIRNSLAALCTHRLRFAHGDLGMHNIMVKDGKITGIIDWEYAGWYPEYWEYVKMVQFSRDKLFLCWCRERWEIEGRKVHYDREYVVDQMLNSQVRHGERMIRRPR